MSVRDLETMEQLQRFLRPLERHVRGQQEPEAERRWHFVKRSIALWAKTFREPDDSQEEALCRAWRLWYFALIGAGREFVPWMLSSFVAPALPPLPEVDKAYERAVSPRKKNPRPPRGTRPSLKLIRGGRS